MHYFVVKPPSAGHLQILPPFGYPSHHSPFPIVTNFTQSQVNSHRLKYTHTEFGINNDFIVLDSSNGAQLIKHIILEITIIERNIVLEV